VVVAGLCSCRTNFGDGTYELAGSNLFAVRLDLNGVHLNHQISGGGGRVSIVGQPYAAPSGITVLSGAYEPQSDGMFSFGSDPLVSSGEADGFIAFW